MTDILQRLRGQFAARDKVAAVLAIHEARLARLIRELAKSEGVPFMREEVARRACSEEKDAA